MWEFAMEHYITFFFCFYLMCLLLESALRCIAILVRGYPENDEDGKNILKSSLKPDTSSCRNKDCDKCEDRYDCNPNVGKDEP